MKVFLTGATGFIGSHLARHLIREGASVYALIRPGSSTWRISDVLSDLKIVPGDLMDFAGVQKELKSIRPDAAIHLAWYAGPDDYLVNPKNTQLVAASLNLAEAVASAGCPKMIGSGTCFEYDTSLGTLSEDSPTKPQTLYAACKLSLGLILEQFARNSGMQMAWLRFFHPYGPFEHQRRLVPSVILSLLKNETIKVTSGEQVRDFLHIKDVAAAIWEVAKSDLTGPVNIGSGIPVTIREMATRIGALMNRLELIRFGAREHGTKASDPMFVCANVAKLKENTAWRPRLNLEEGLTQTIEAWKTRSGHFLTSNLS